MKQLKDHLKLRSNKPDLHDLKHISGGLSIGVYVVKLSSAVRKGSLCL